MKRIILGIIVSWGFLFGMFEFQGDEPIALQMGYSTMTLPDMTNAMFYNPALLSEPMTLGKAFFFSQYSSSGLGITTYGVGIRFKTFGISFIEKGASLSGSYSGRYSEGRYAISYGKSMSENLSVGIGFKMYKFSEPRYGATYSPSLDFGLLASKEKWSLGFYWVNITGSDLRNEDVPEYAQVALGFTASSFSRTILQIEAQSGEPIKIGFGEEINLVKDVFKVRGGLMNQGSLSNFSAGFSIHYANIDLDYSVLFIPDMPISHGIGISYRR